MIPPPRAFRSASSCWPGSMESKLAPALICWPGDTWCLVLFSDTSRLTKETQSRNYKNHFRIPKFYPSMSESRCHSFVVRDSPGNVQKPPGSPTDRRVAKRTHRRVMLGCRRSWGGLETFNSQNLRWFDVERCWNMLNIIYDIYIYILYWSFPILFRVESMSICPCTCQYYVYWCTVQWYGPSF